MFTQVLYRAGVEASQRRSPLQQKQPTEFEQLEHFAQVGGLILNNRLLLSTLSKYPLNGAKITFYDLNQSLNR